MAFFLCAGAGDFGPAGFCARRTSLVQARGTVIFQRERRAKGARERPCRCIQSTVPCWHAILCDIVWTHHVCCPAVIRGTTRVLLQACGERRRGRWVGTVSAANAKKDRHHRGDAGPYGFYQHAMRWQAVVADAENDGRMRARWRLAPSGNMRRPEQSESSSIKETPARHPAWHRCVPSPAGKSTRW